jgi:hypothetical protein
LEIWNLKKKTEKYFHDRKSRLLVNLPSLLSNVLHCSQLVLRRRTSGQHLENFISVLGRFLCNKFSLVLIYPCHFFCRPCCECFERLIRFLKPKRNVPFTFRERQRERERERVIHYIQNKLLWQALHKFPDNVAKCTVMLIHLENREL